MTTASSKEAWPSPGKFKPAWGNGAPRITSVKDGAAQVPILVDFRGGWSWRAIKLLPRRARDKPQPMNRYIGFAEPFEKWMIGAKNYYEDRPGRVYAGDSVYDWGLSLWEPPLIRNMLVPVYMLRDITNDVAQESNEATSYEGDEGDEESSSSSSSDSEWESSPAGTPNTKSSFTPAAASAPASTVRDGQGELPSIDNAGLYYGDDFDADYADAYGSDSEDNRDADEDEGASDDAGSGAGEFNGANFFEHQFAFKVGFESETSACDASQDEDDSDEAGSDVGELKFVT